MNLVYYHPIALESLHPLHRCVNPLISLMDRSQQKWPEFDYEILFPMPKNPKKQDFLDLCYNRIRELCSSTDTVTLLWSGGIDSTFILCLMIDTGIADQLYKEKRFNIAINLASSKENPVMYSEVISKKYTNCLVQADKVLKNPQHYGKIITGEMADNLTGSLTMKSCVDYYNDFSVIHEDWKTRSLDWFTRNLDDVSKDIAIDNILDIVKTSPIEILTAHDLFWYLNFNLKWQAVNFRIASHCLDQDTGNLLIKHLVHFFNTEKFQEWSILEGHYFVGNSWAEYKMPLKDFIFSVTKDRNYFENKIKFPSLSSLLKFKDTFDFIYKEEDKYVFSKEKINVFRA